MKAFKLLALGILALIVTSCGTTTKVTPYSFNQVRLEMGMNDLEYLGEAEVSVEYSTYLGIFSSIEKVNGEKYDPAHKKRLKLPGDNLFHSSKLSLAAYKLVELYPNAVYFQVVYESQDVDKLFLGSTKKVYAKVRAYNIKNPKK